MSSSLPKKIGIIKCHIIVFLSSREIFNKLFFYQLFEQCEETFAGVTQLLLSHSSLRRIAADDDFFPLLNLSRSTDI
jgi:hypothetical protein